MNRKPVPMPARYEVPWRSRFDDPVRERLAPGMSVIDIGSGRHPAVAVEERPESVDYVGLDLSLEELEAAGPGAYSETVAADATVFQPELAGRFDLALSWQVLEHVSDLEATIGNVRRYLKPGGSFVAMFSGAWSSFGVINRILPDRIGAKVVDRTMKRTENNIPVFPAHYDKCTARALRPVLADWSGAELIPEYHGAPYFDFLPPVKRVYLAFENLLERRRLENLATHYLLIAER